MDFIYQFWEKLDSKAEPTTESAGKAYGYPVGICT